MRGYASVIWAWNSTLLDDVDLSLGIVNELLSDHGVPPLTLSRYKDIFDVPVSLYWERAGLDLNGEERQMCCTLLSSDLAWPWYGNSIRWVDTNPRQRDMV